MAVFDALGRKSTHGTYTAGNAPILTQAYRYDGVGNIRRNEEYYGSALPGQTVTMAYDGAHRLSSEVRVTAASGPSNDVVTTASTFGYDAANNRTTKSIVVGHSDGSTGSSVTTTYAVNALNQVTGYSDTTGRSVSFGYDLDGNRTSRSENGVQTHTYAFDSNQRLSGVQRPAAGAAPAATFNYVYDHRARRVSRTEPGTGGFGLATTRVTFAGSVSVMEQIDGVPSVDYIRGPDMGGGVGGLLYSASAGNAIKLNHYNRRGDVIGQSNPSGVMTWQAAYNAFGTRSAEWGTNTDRQKANTKEEDPTGLLNEGHRYRCLETDVFISRDPAGFVDGPNLYTFVRQNPWTSWDPKGLSTKLNLDGTVQVDNHPTPSFRQRLDDDDTRRVTQKFLDAVEPGINELGYGTAVAVQTAAEIADWSLSFTDDHGGRQVFGGMGIRGFLEMEGLRVSMLPAAGRVLSASAKVSMVRGSVVAAEETLTIQTRVWTDFREAAAAIQAHARLEAGPYEFFGMASRTRTGATRNNPADWRSTVKLWDELGYGDVLSEGNRLAIRRGLTPEVDVAWLKMFPEHAPFIGELIPMHHITEHSQTA